jgi:hypothetical protein
MEGVEKNLHSKNRDRFTHGLSVFRREVNDVLKVSILGDQKISSDEELSEPDEDITVNLTVPF